jgi:hypothetical protein
MDSIRFVEQPDTASIRMFIRCDSLNRAYVESYELLNGKYIKLLKDFKGNVITVTAYKDRIVHDTVVTRKIQYKIIPKYIEKKPPFNWWLLISGILIGILIIVSLRWLI